MRAFDAPYKVRGGHLQAEALTQHHSRAYWQYYQGDMDRTCRTSFHRE